MSADAPSFDVMTHDVHGASVCCSHCDRPVPCVVVLPIAQRPSSSDQSPVATEGGPFWIGLCAYCVLAMARALAQNINEEPE